MRFIIVLGLVAALSGADLSASRRVSAQPASHSVSYDEFVKLTPEERRIQFVTLSAEQKALIQRTHAERWLAANRNRLTAEQIAVTTEAMAFVTPQIYLQPNDPGIAKQEEAVKHKLTCVLGHDNARDAFVFDASPSISSRVRDWRSTMDAWWFWFSKCVVP